MGWPECPRRASGVTPACEHPFVGYRGKVVERQEARSLRAQGLTMPEIAGKLGVSRSSVSLWTRDVPFEARRRQYRPGSRSTHRLHVEKMRQIEELDQLGRDRLARLDDDAFLVAGTALYAGEGGKTDGQVHLANSDPSVVAFYCKWLRYFFDIDETRLRVRVYLHQGLDLDEAERFWSEVTGVPGAQFGKSYRAVPDASIRHNKHIRGCVYVDYSCSRTHRAIMGLVRALLTCPGLPIRGGVIGNTADC